MRVRILGSAAGGGLPQWNCRCPNCSGVRAGSPGISARTQSSLAITADGDRWFLFNVSPDIRQQIQATPELTPSGGGGRATAIAGCVLTDAELDHVSGLLLIREGCAFPVISTRLVREWLTEHFPVQPVLSHFAPRPWIDLPLDEPIDLPAGVEKAPSGLRLRAFETGRDVPRFVVGAAAADAAGSVIGLEISDVARGTRVVYAPGVPEVNEALRAAADGADAILMDGTFWSDEEPRAAGITDVTAREMGHLPVAGAGGSLGWLGGLPVRHRVYVHVNNTNPMLNAAGPERRRVDAAGVRVGADGDLFDL